MSVKNKVVGFVGILKRLQLSVWVLLSLTALAVIVPRFFISSDILSFMSTFSIIFVTYMSMNIYYKYYYPYENDYTKGFLPYNIDSVRDDFEVGSLKYIVNEDNSDFDNLGVLANDTVRFSRGLYNNMWDKPLISYKTVFAHELAHIEKNHMLKKLLLNAVLFGVFFSIITISSIAFILMSFLLLPVMFLTYNYYSTIHEYSADRTVVKRMGVKHGVAFYDFINNNANDRTGISELVSTHPGREQRLENIKSAIYDVCEKELEGEVDCLSEFD